MKGFPSLQSSQRIAEVSLLQRERYNLKCDETWKLYIRNGTLKICPEDGNEWGE